jgi:hypothetical protein
MLRLDACANLESCVQALHLRTAAIRGFCSRGASPGSTSASTQPFADDGAQVVRVDGLRYELIRRLVEKRLLRL